jgi:hypothetical protein
MRSFSACDSDFPLLHHQLLLLTSLVLSHHGLGSMQPTYPYLSFLIYLTSQVFDQAYSLPLSLYADTEIPRLLDSIISFFVGRPSFEMFLSTSGFKGSLLVGSLTNARTSPILYRISRPKILLFSGNADLFWEFSQRT